MLTKKGLTAGIAGKIIDSTTKSVFTFSFPWFRNALLVSTVFSCANELGLSLLKNMGIDSQGMFFLVATLNGKIMYHTAIYIMEKHYKYTRKYTTFFAKRSISALLISYILIESGIIWWRRRQSKKQMKEYLKSLSRKVRQNNDSTTVKINKTAKWPW